MFRVEISNHCVVELAFITNATEVQDRLDQAFKEVMEDFRRRDTYRIAVAEAAAEGASRMQAGDQTDRYFRLRRYYQAAATLAAQRASRR